MSLTALPRLVAVGLLLAGTAAEASTPDTATAIRAGDHPGFGRIVIDTNASAIYNLDQSGNHVIVHFISPVTLGPAPAPPRNVEAIKTTGQIIDLTLRGGSVVHPSRMGDRFVIDVLDPARVASGKTERKGKDAKPAGSVASKRLGADSASVSDSNKTTPATSAPDPKQNPRASATPDQRPDVAVERTSAPSASASSAPVASSPSGSAAAAHAPGVNADPKPETVSASTAEPHAQSGSVASSGTSSESHAPAAAPRTPVESQPLTGLSRAPVTPPTGQSPTPAESPPLTGQHNAPPPSATPVLEVMKPAAVPERDAATAAPPPPSMGLLARRVKLPKDMDGSAFVVPTSPTAAAAVFQASDTAYVVFDERRAIDMSGLRGDPVFGQASVQLLPSGTVITVPVPPPLTVAVTPTPQGWRIATLAAASRPHAIDTALTNSGYLNFMANDAGGVISLPDPDTGATLLVGTQHRPGEAVTTARHAGEFIVRPSLQGVVIEPLADWVVMKPAPTGFSLIGRPEGLALSAPSSVDGDLLASASLTRSLTLPAMEPQALLHHLTEQIADAGATPSMARGPKHRAAAETMLAMGLSAEAESLLQATAEQDPKEAASPETAALTGVAALLAGRPGDSAGLDDARLTATDEIALWRAIRQAMSDPGSPGAAAVFAATAPLALSYPGAVRDRILPLMVETMIQGGEIAPATRVLDQRPDDPRLAYARALRAQAEGNQDHALEMLVALASGHDQADRARAAVQAIEMRLATRQVDAKQAADGLDKLLYAWRGDDRELDLRERVAGLRAQTGAWREAFSILRQAEADFPDKAPALHTRLKDSFADMVRGGGAETVKPIDLIALVDENADLINGSGNEDAIGQILAERLVALDLPGRAKPLLQKLVHSAASGATKTRLETSLATLQAQDNEYDAVLATLGISDPMDVPAELAEQRMLLRAHAMAGTGDTSGGAALLGTLKTGTATKARAELLEAANDWSAAEPAWRDCIAATVPEDGVLDDASIRTVLRLATAAGRAGDSTTLSALRSRYDSRIGPGPLGDIFRLLTAEPVRSANDIGRSAHETSWAGSLPAGLRALRPDTVTR